MFQQSNMNIMHIFQKNMMIISLLRNVMIGWETKAFLKRIKQLNKYKNFTTKEELLREVKKVLKYFIHDKLESSDFDSELLMGFYD